MAVQPTPTQLENDLAAMGFTVMNKRDDGSPEDPNHNPPDASGHPPPEQPPVENPPDPEPKK